jgi:Ran GTPase-activating protein (RanGAP) involved in mRNA processing and transport
VEEIDFTNNMMGDMIGAIVLLSAFMNPSIRSISYNGNNLKSCSVETLSELMRHHKEKLHGISMFASILFVDNLEKFVRKLQFNKRLRDLNLAGNCFSLKATSIMGQFIIFHGTSLRELNLSHCKIGY